MSVVRTPLMVQVGSMLIDGPSLLGPPSSPPRRLLSFPLPPSLGSIRLDDPCEIKQSHSGRLPSPYCFPIPDRLISCSLLACSSFYSFPFPISLFTLFPLLDLLFLPHSNLLFLGDSLLRPYIHSFLQLNSIRSLSFPLFLFLLLLVHQLTHSLYLYHYQTLPPLLAVLCSAQPNQTSPNSYYPSGASFESTKPIHSLVP